MLSKSSYATCIVTKSIFEEICMATHPALQFVNGRAFASYLFAISVALFELSLLKQTSDGSGEGTFWGCPHPYTQLSEFDVKNAQIQIIALENFTSLAMENLASFASRPHQYGFSFLGSLKMHQFLAAMHNIFLVSFIVVLCRNFVVHNFTCTFLTLCFAELATSQVLQRMKPYRCSPVLFQKNWAISFQIFSCLFIYSGLNVYPTLSTF